MSEGTDKLIKRILQDAQSEADRILSDAQDRCNEIAEQARKTVSEIESRGEETAKREESDIVFLAKKNAELEAKKADLAMRHTLIDEVFSEALSAIRSMDEKATAEFLERIIDRETDGGETICPTSDNRSIVVSVVSALNAHYRSTDKTALNIGDSTDEIADGIMICGTGFVKNCSYGELLADLKEREIGSISDILF